MREWILVLGQGSDELAALPNAWCVSERDEAAAVLASESVRAICLSEPNVEETLQTARWLRRRRNAHPVLALIDPDEMSHASDLFGSGVREILLRGVDCEGALRRRLRALEPTDTLTPRSAEGLVASSPAMRSSLELVAKAQSSHATALILGETGTGKEVIARLIHDGGLRAQGAFVGINCAAFPETLLESELFGYERGAFTGANRTKRGLFEVASGGSLFLDEIGETSLGFQVKLLRVLQEGMIRPLGSTREIKVDVRILAATNKPLLQEVEMGHFRQDLYYRLHVFPIELPPLRSRIEDVVPLAELFLSRFGSSLRRITPDAARLLEMHPWPGNVRELENEIARIVAHAEAGSEVTARMLSPQLQGHADGLPHGSDGETLRAARARFERWFIRNALRRHNGRKVATARSLGITRECLYKKLIRYDMQ